MLTLLLALAGSEAVARPTREVDTPMVRVVPAVDPQILRCDSMLLPANRDRPQEGALQLDRSLDDGQARRYLLLDRRDQNNCPLPISYPVPDQPKPLGLMYGLDGDSVRPVVRPD